MYVFDSLTYTGFTGTSDVNGEMKLNLPECSYRFRADYNGTQFWSGAGNRCAIPGCSTATMQVTLPVTVTVEDTNGVLKEGVPVYAFDVTTTRSPLQHPRNPPQLAELTVLRLGFCFNNWEAEDLRLKIELGSGVLSS
jgi:hypothetical protein